MSEDAVELADREHPVDLVGVPMGFADLESGVDPQVRNWARQRSIASR